PGRVFWRVDEELLDEGSPRVIVYRYDGLPMQPVAPPSPDYIPGLEEPQTPLAPQDKDEREPMFIHSHDPDYVPEPMYPEYIPLEDEHVLPAEEQPLPPIDSPTGESPGYVAESDPKEDPEEYEYDETEDGLVDYPMDEEMMEMMMTTIHLGMTYTMRMRTRRMRKAEVGRLLAMPTPPPSPLTSLSPPSAGELLARCTAPSVCPSPPPVPSPLLPSSGCPTQIQTLRMASTQALIDTVTVALPSPPLPPPLYIPPPVDYRDDIPETEMPPRKRLCLSTLSRYEIGKSSTARPTRGRGIDYGFVSTLDAEVRQRGIGEVGYGIRDTWVDPTEAVLEIVPMTLGERIDLLMEDRIAHQETILIVEEDAYVTQEAWVHSIGLSQAVHSELQTHMQQAKIAELRETGRRRQVQLVETLRVMGDMRQEMGDMQAELLVVRERPRRARQPVPDARIPDH
nr:hypothetical protein [Tanacetum cinerariifolium]